MVLVVVGVGQYVDQDELEGLAGRADRVFWVEDYSELEAVRDEIVAIMCQGRYSVLNTYTVCKGAYSVHIQSFMVGIMYSCRVSRWV